MSMAVTELQKGKRWIEERLPVKAAEAGIQITKLDWTQAGDDFTRDLYTLRFRANQQRIVERFSRENLEDCPNDRTIRQKLEGQLTRLLRRIASDTLEESLTSEERGVLEELFIGFSNEAKFPPSREFEIAQKLHGRIRAFDSLFSRGVLRHEDGTVKFSPQWYFRSKWGAADKEKIQRLVPILTEMYMSNPDGMHNVEDLKSRALGHNLAPIRPINLQRLLVVSRWVGLVGGYTEKEEAGKKLFTTFQVSSQALRCEDLDEFIEQYYPSIANQGAPTAPPELLAKTSPGSRRTTPRKFETTFGSYEEVASVGEGGSGRVFKVRDEDGVFYAVKIIDPKKTTTEKLKRFKNEIGFCRKNNHSNIVQVVADGLILDGEVRQPFYVMPFYTGSLRDRMKQGLPAEDVLPLFASILDGVEAAHLQSVVHRDLKPENILVGSSSIVVADFGIARFEEEDLLTAVETRNQQRLANFLYAAPEQRKKGAIVDHRADIFALGLILNELFTREVPQGTGYKTISSIAPAFGYLDALIELMIRQEAQERPATIAAVKAALLHQGNEFVSQQKLSQLQNTVIPLSELEDELITNPPTLSRFDYQRGTLTLFFNRPVNERWIDALRNMGSYQAIHRKGPEAYSISGNSASIAASDEREVQMLIDHFKEWLPIANRKYHLMMEQQLAAGIIAEKQRLATEIAEEERRQRILKNIKL